MKRYLFTPGPTPVPPEVLLEMAHPIIHHRTAAYSDIFQDVREGLKYVFQTRNEVLVLASSGTGAMEAAVTNLLCKGDRVLVVRGGKFGERWAEICTAYGVEPVNIDVEWGRAVDPVVVERALTDQPDIKAVLLQASETSTGVMQPVRELAMITRERENTFIAVDAISGLGVFDLPMDEWGLDVVVSGSQKAFMLPPGLAFIALSEKAWRFNKISDLPKYYFDLAKEKKQAEKNQSAYTPAVSLIVGLKRSLDMIREEGLEGLFARHSMLAKASRAAMKALGLQLLAEESPSSAVTVVKSPPGIDAQDVIKICREKFGVVLAGGQGGLKGKVFRIGHMGYVDKFDIVAAVSAIEMALSELGFDVKLGAGVAAAQAVFEGERRNM